MNYHFHQDLLHDENMLKESFLVKPADVSDILEAKFALGTTASASKEMMTHVGRLVRGHYVQCVVAIMVKINLFLELRMHFSPSVLLLVGYPHDSAGPNTWAR